MSDRIARLKINFETVWIRYIGSFKTVAGLVGILAILGASFFIFRPHVPELSSITLPGWILDSWFYENSRYQVYLLFAGIITTWLSYKI